MSVDWALGPVFDLTNRKVQQLVLGWILAGIVAFFLAGIPRQSWSRARMQPGGPHMLRNLAHIVGLPILRYESERPKIVNGNIAIAFSAQVAQSCLGMATLFMFENDWNSLLWKAPQMQHVQRRKNVRMARADVCQLGRLGGRAPVSSAVSPTSHMSTVSALAAETSAPRMVIPTSNIMVLILSPNNFGRISLSLIPEGMALPWSR